ncbi:hypothetical protein BGZ76_005437, partial [Entomortierella beljakovae]
MDNSNFYKNSKPNDETFEDSYDDITDDDEIFSKYQNFSDGDDDDSDYESGLSPCRRSPTLNTKRHMSLNEIKMSSSTCGDSFEVLNENDVLDVIESSEPSSHQDSSASSFVE